MKQRCKLIERRWKRQASLSQRARLRQQRGAVRSDQRVGDAIDVFRVDRAEHRADDFAAHFASAIGDRLVEQGQRVAHRSARGVGDREQRSVVECDLLGSKYLRQARNDLRRRQRLEIELKAPRQDGDRDLLRVGGSKDEFHVLGWLLQRLEHGVERRFRQHMHFVDQVNLVAPDRRRVARVVENLPHVVDAGVRRRVELEQIDEAAGIDVDACRAHAAWRCRDAVDAVEALGEDARDRRLADTARAGEKVRVMQAAALDRIGQRLYDVLLAGKLAKTLRTPLAGENLIAHRWKARARKPRRLVRAAARGRCATPHRYARDVQEHGVPRKIAW